METGLEDAVPGGSGRGNRYVQIDFIQGEGWLEGCSEYVEQTTEEK